VRAGWAGGYGSPSPDPHSAPAPASAPVFGRLERAGEVIGTFHRIPDRRISLASLAPEHAGALADHLAGLGRTLPGVVGGHDAATAFAQGWQRRTGATPVPGVRLLLYRLGTLTAPEPFPAGRARPAADRDQEQLMSWLRQFAADVGEDVTIDAATWAGTRFAGKHYTFWDTPDGTPASVAGRTPLLAGHVRVDPVYTPRPLRGRGYAAAATIEATRAALAEGATDVVLFTDPANRTSNALYRRLGYVLLTPVTVYDFAYRETG
jgi:RimJ/RimL family protein N-acetyltransferase